MVIEASDQGSPRRRSYALVEVTLEVEEKELEEEQLETATESAKRVPKNVEKSSPDEAKKVGTVTIEKVEKVSTGRPTIEKVELEEEPRSADQRKHSQVN